MRLWTFQASKAVKILRQEGRLVVPWTFYKFNDGWKASYRWMAHEMIQTGIDCEGNAPIWAWHSCNAYGQAPNLGDARALLADIEIEAGIETLELECPDELVLLSRYGAWNRILEHFIDGKPASDVPQKHLKNLYHTDIQQLEENQAIQATLPYLSLDWVIDIRPLNLKSGDWSDYDEPELV